MTPQDYLIEMNFTPFATLLSPQELLAFTERMALPTLEGLEKLAASGRILAGGTSLAAIGFTFIARVNSPEELEDMLGSLPLWPRAQTRVVALGTFARRTVGIRGMLERLKAANASQDTARTLP
jgi:hypothetical protein